MHAYMSANERKNGIVYPFTGGKVQSHFVVGGGFSSKWCNRIILLVGLHHGNPENAKMLEK